MSLPPKRAPSVWRSALAQALAPALAAAALASVAGCSAQQCKDMNGNLAASLFCGGQGTDAPEPPPPALVCKADAAVMADFYHLLTVDSAAFAGLRQTVRSLDTSVCLQSTVERACPSDGRLCPNGFSCGDDGLCPCQLSYNPLGDVISHGLSGLLALAGTSTGPEANAAVGARCAAVEAAPADPAQRQPMCEMRRMLDVLFDPNHPGAKGLLTQPEVINSLVGVLCYAEGPTSTVAEVDAICQPYHFDRPHYEVLEAVGWMGKLGQPQQSGGAVNRCDPSHVYQLLDSVLAWGESYANSKQAITHLRALLDDRATRQFLETLNYGGAHARDALIVVVSSTLPGLLAAPDATLFTAQLDVILDSLLPGLTAECNARRQLPVDQRAAGLHGELCDVKDDVHQLLDPAGANLFPPLQKVLECLSIDVNQSVPFSGLVGVLYDLILLQPSGNVGIGFTDLLRALSDLIDLDRTGQVPATLRIVLGRARSSPDTTAAIAKLFESAFLPVDGVGPPPVAQMLPGATLILQNQVLKELFTLLQEVFYDSCAPAN